VSDRKQKDKKGQITFCEKGTPSESLCQGIKESLTPDQIEWSNFFDDKGKLKSSLEDALHFIGKRSGFEQ